MRAIGRNDIVVVLRNLVHNALKYTAEGTVRIEVTHREKAGRVDFWVRDTGPGIPEGEKALIFEMFGQSHHLPVRDDGVGLGLFIVKRLTEALGGSVDLDSRPGQGSTFSVSLPVGAERG